AAGRLSAEDAERLADVDRRAACKIPTVADRTDAVTHLAGQRRTDTDRLNARTFDRLHVALVDQLAGRHDHLARNRMHDILKRRAAKHALADGSHHLTGVHDGLHGEALVGAAIWHRHDAVLRHVHQTAGEVTGVRRL